jgi:threonine/homoserine/homoserine lactone efflux protein
LDWTHIASFAFVAALLVMSPGPNGVLIAKTVPTSGRAAGFANIAGFVSAFYVHGALSILGISVILVQSAQAFLVVKLIGAAYLCWLGLKALRDAFRGVSVAPHIQPAARKRTLLVAYTEGFLTNVLNPKVAMFYLAAFPQFIPAHDGAVSGALILVVVHSALNFIWFSAMVLVVTRLKGVASSGAVQRWLKGVTGAVFLAFGAKLATAQQP